LHAQGATFRLVLTPSTRVRGTPDRSPLPLGPNHQVTVLGHAGGEELLPSVIVEHMEVSPRLDVR